MGATETPTAVAATEQRVATAQAAAADQAEAPTADLAVTATNAADQAEAPRVRRTAVHVPATNAVLTESARASAGAPTIGTHPATTTTSVAVAAAAQAVPKAQDPAATSANVMTSPSRQPSAVAIQRPRRIVTAKAATPTSRRPRTRVSAATRARADRTHLPLAHLPCGT